MLKDPQHKPKRTKGENQTKARFQRDKQQKWLKLRKDKSKGLKKTKQNIISKNVHFFTYLLTYIKV